MLLINNYVIFTNSFFNFYEDTMNKKIKILIADDEELNHIFYREILSPEKYELYFVDNGHDALNFLEANNPRVDLILMDMKMPGIDGYAATIEIRKTDKNIPILAQTAYAYREDIQKALDAGCNDYISKPIHEDILIKKFEKLLKQ